MNLRFEFFLNMKPTDATKIEFHRAQYKVTICSEKL